MAEGQVAVLTGCGSGIGQHLANSLVAKGFRVVATDINCQAVEENAQKMDWKAEQVKIRPLDVRNPAEWQQIIQLAADTWGKIDIVMNIAGYLRPGFIHETPTAQVDAHIDTNTKGVILGTQAAAEFMVRQGYGHIINIASLAGIAPVPGLCLYVASKFAVRGFSLAVAQELRPHGVYVTAVCPDLVQTPMLDLQLYYKEAAISFSGSKALTVQDIEKAVMGKVLKQKPVEILIPRHRGWLSKFANTFPGVSFAWGQQLAKKGLARQAQEREKRGL